MGHSEKVSFSKLHPPESLVILEIRERPKSVENKGEAHHLSEEQKPPQNPPNIK